MSIREREERVESSELGAEWSWGETEGDEVGAGESAPTVAAAAFGRWWGLRLKLGQWSVVKILVLVLDFALGAKAD